MPNNSISAANSHKEIVRWLFEEVWTRGTFGEVRKHIASQITFHFRGKPSILSPDDLIQIVNRWRTPFPDLRSVQSLLSTTWLQCGSRTMVPEEE